MLLYTISGVSLTLSVFWMPFAATALRKFNLPFVPAATKQLVAITQALKGRSGTLLDVGSGDGRIVFLAAEQGFKADGVELNPWLVYYSRFISQFSPQYQKCTFYRQDLWKFNLKPYNNIVICGIEQMMGKFEEKLSSECTEDTVVVSCRYPLPNMIPIEVIGRGVYTVWKYKIKK